MDEILAKRYYTEVNAKILEIFKTEKYAILIELIFRQMSDESIFRLGKYYLENSEFHQTLKKLNQIICPRELKKRYLANKRKCFIYENLIIPGIGSKLCDQILIFFPCIIWGIIF